MKSRSDVSQIFKKFKKLIEITFHKLIFEKYIVHDIKTRRELTDYVQAILRYAKIININNVENQLTFAY